MRRAAPVLLFMVVCSALLGGCSAGIQNDGEFRFGRNVPPEEREPIMAGVDAMKAWLEQEGDVRLKRLSIEVDDNLNTLVSRYAHYNADGDPLLTAQWLVSGGALAVGDVIYIYAGPEWEDYEDWQKSLIAAHEVFHVAQFGFIYDDWWAHESEPQDYPPTWLVEGGADYAAARALDAAGIRAYDDIRASVESRSASYPGTLDAISSPEGDHASGDAAPYAVGFLAIERLAGASGEAAMFEFWDGLSETGSWEASFAAAFGGPVDEFVASFDSARSASSDRLTGGVAGRLVREGGSPVTGASVAACRTDTFECRSTWTADDGEFLLALPPGEYEVVFRVATRESVELGTFEHQGAKAERVEVGTEIVRGLTASVRKPL